MDNETLAKKKEVANAIAVNKIVSQILSAMLLGKIKDKIENMNKKYSEWYILCLYAGNCLLENKIK